jgi:hypothetical protein
MGYTLLIGDIKDGQIAEVTSEQAPAIPGDRYPRMNKRQPSYNEWSDFCEATGLRRFFLEGLLVPHPGINYITPLHAQAITSAKARYLRAHPQAQAINDGTPENMHLARLVWLEWWMQWALEHCRYPGIQNS